MVVLDVDDDRLGCTRWFAASRMSVVDALDRRGYPRYGRKWPELADNGQKWPETGQKVAEIRQYWQEEAGLVHNRSEMGRKWQDRLLLVWLGECAHG